MNDLLKHLFKVGLNGIIWVFILSVTWDGRTLFSRANETLVQNSVVQAIDEELADLWIRLSETAKVTFNKDSTNGDTDESLQ